MAVRLIDRGGEYLVSEAQRKVLLEMLVKDVERKMGLLEDLLDREITTAEATAARLTKERLEKMNLLEDLKYTEF